MAPPSPGEAFGSGLKACDNGEQVNSVEYQKHQYHDVAEEVARLALAEQEYRPALAAIRQYAAGLLAEGYPREELYAELDRARDMLGRRGAPEEAEDPILDVMDFLVGWCSPGTKL